MKTLSFLFAAVLFGAGAWAQQTQSSSTIQMQCRTLASGQNNFLQSNEIMVNGKACHPVAANPSGATAQAAATQTNQPNATQPPAANGDHAAVPPANPAASVATAASAAPPQPKPVAVPPAVEKASEIPPSPETTKPETMLPGSSEYFTNSEIGAASFGNPKGVTITAGGGLGQAFAASLANVNLTQEASVHLYTAESWIALRARTIRGQYKDFTPDSLTQTEKERGLVVVGFGAALGTDAGPQCGSVTRIALISDKNGEVVAEAVNQDSSSSTWSNAFGASATCQALVAKFSAKDVARVSSAARNGEYFIGVFSGSDMLFMYKVKTKFLKELAKQ